MNTKTPSQFHTVDDEWLASYCAGGLSAAKRFVVACQAAINPHLAQRLDRIDTVGGVLLESAKGETLSDNFMTRLFDHIDTTKTQMPSPNSAKENDMTLEAWLPAPLADFFNRGHQSLQWKNMGFGMARIPIMEEGKEKLYLLKSRAGMKVPKHSHHGEEWALILQGGYHVEAEGYVRGDLHREDETCTHRPIVDNHGEDCITLVASEGGLKFSNPAISLLKPILGL